MRHKRVTQECKCTLTNSEYIKGYMFLLLVCVPVTSDHVCILRNLKYNTVELCLDFHVNSVCICTVISSLYIKELKSNSKGFSYDIGRNNKPPSLKMSGDIQLNK